MPILATDALVHFNLNPFGVVSFLAAVLSTICWIIVDLGLEHSTIRHRFLPALAPVALLSLYAYSLASGSADRILGISHIGGWSRRFSTEECLAAYILLAVSFVLSLRVLRTPGNYFKTIGLIELALTLAFGAREVYEIVREHV